MKYQKFKLFNVLVMIVLVGACTTSYQPIPSFTPVNIMTKGRTLKTENLLVIIDTSSSMAEDHRKWRKIDVATAVVRNMIQTIPADLGIKSALRTFGHDPEFSAEDTLSISEMENFDSAGLVKALTTVTLPGGPSLMGKAIDAADGDLKNLVGNNALFIVSDGKDLGKEPVMAAMALKEKYKDALCIYPILVGNAPDGKVLMDNLAQIGKCGFTVNADDLSGGQQMADYASKIFIGGALDRDGDGVADALDKCLGTPYEAEVDAIGCPLDTDGDSVPDFLDDCPSTPYGLKIDDSGCPHTTFHSDARSLIFNEISFDVGRADIKPSSHKLLDDIVVALDASPELKFVVEGHTDNMGIRLVNMDLAKRRAQAVIDYLVGKGISSSRLTAKGYGPDRPLADNGTWLGRSKNRRVQFTKIE